MGERENVARGLVPRWGRGGAWQNPQCQFAVPNNNSGFSYLGVPAPAGMGDCYENIRPAAHAGWAPPTPSMGEGWGEGEARSVEACTQPMARRPTILIPASQFVIPAKAGIQGRGMRGENDPQTPPPTSALNLPVSSLRLPTSSFRRRPESRRGGVGQDRHAMGKNPASHHFHPLMRPSQGHGDSCESLPRTPIRGQESRGEVGGKTIANLW